MTKEELIESLELSESETKAIDRAVDVVEKQEGIDVTEFEESDWKNVKQLSKKIHSTLNEQDDEEMDDEEYDDDEEMDDEEYDDDEEEAEEMDQEPAGHADDRDIDSSDIEDDEDEPDGGDSHGDRMDMESAVGQFLEGAKELDEVKSELK